MVPATLVLWVQAYHDYAQRFSMGRWYLFYTIPSVIMLCHVNGGRSNNKCHFNINILTIQLYTIIK